MAAGTIVKTAEDAIAVAFQIVEAAKNEIVWLIPPSLLSLSSTYDILDKVKAFIQNGGVLRGITIISRANVEETRLRLGIGEDVRHAGYYQELFMLIGDKQYSISAINTGTQEYTQDTRIVAFWRTILCTQSTSSPPLRSPGHNQSLQKSGYKSCYARTPQEPEIAHESVAQADLVTFVQLS